MNPAEAAGFSKLGFGVTGPHAGLAVPRRQTERLIREAIDLGVTLFDTGPAYGGGEAEKRLGKALAGMRRDTVFVATKAGIHPGRRRDFSAGAVEMSLKGSLERLNCGHIDLLLLHGPAPEEITERLLNHLEAFRERGLFRHLGVCGRGAELDRAIEAGRFEAVMAPVNAALDRASRDRLDRAKAAGMAVLGIEVMAGARHPARVPRDTGDAWYAARRLKQRLTGTAPAASGRSPGEALNWALAQPAVDAVVCLTTKSRNLRANAAAAGLEARTRAS